MKVLQYVFTLQIIFLCCSYLYTQEKNESTLYAQTYISPQESVLSLTNIQSAMENPNFATEIFPDDFSCLYGLLGLGKTMQYSPTFAVSVFTTFGHITHGSPYINAYAMRDLLKDLPDLLHNYLKNNSKNSSFIDSIKSNVNDFLYSKFTSKYTSFKNDPEKFLQTISGDVTVMIASDLNMAGLEVQLVRFLELAISKLIWSPEEYKESWESVKLMSEYLAELVNKNVLTNGNHFNDLSWALVQRYANYLGTFIETIPSSFYQEIRNEISQKDLILFGLDENKHTITQSKYALLNRKLFECEARSKAIEKGVILG